MHFDLFQKILIWAIPLLFAITVHEMAHGWVASLRGDQTAARLGRLSPNPLRHIDPVGTVIVPAVLYFLGGFVFGWAKPVPVDWRNLKHPRRDMALVAFAGPGANFVMAVFWVVLAKCSIWVEASAPWMAFVLFNMAVAGVLVNLMLGVFNLFPIPPLDGSRIVSSLLKPSWAWQYERLERYGLIILLALLASGILGKILFPIINVLMHQVMVFLGP